MVRVCTGMACARKACHLHISFAAGRQGLTLVRFSAQPEPFLLVAPPKPSNASAPVWCAFCLPPRPAPPVAHIIVVIGVRRHLQLTARAGGPQPTKVFKESRKLDECTPPPTARRATARSVAQQEGHCEQALDQYRSGTYLECKRITPLSHAGMRSKKDYPRSPMLESNQRPKDYWNHMCFMC